MVHKISGFTDEISSKLETQISVSNALDMRYIEVRGVNGKNISSHTLEEAEAVKKQLDAGGIKVSALGSPIGKTGITDDLEAAYKNFLHCLELCKVLETKYMRMFSFYIPKGEYAKYRDDVMRELNRYSEAAKKYGVILAHENESGIYGDITERCVDILENTDIGCVFDPANFVNNGVKPLEAYAALKSKIDYFHIKDMTAERRVVPAGMGVGSIPEILKDMIAGGFDGFYSIEPHLKVFQGLDDLQKEELKHGRAFSSGEEAFRAAHGALVKILNDIG